MFTLRVLSAEFLEVNFPLRIQQNQKSVPMQKVKVDDMIPGLEKELPKNARLERGGIAPGAGGGIPGGAAGTAGAVMPTIEAPVSVAQLAKRVAADQLGMLVYSMTSSYTSPYRTATDAIH